MPYTLKNKRDRVAKVLDATGLGSLLRWCRLWNGLLVLNYHRIGPPLAAWGDRGVFSATQEEFDQQVRFLKREFDLISTREIEGVLGDRHRRAILLTFDDGYRDNFELALPVLQAHHTQAIFFLTTSFLDRTRVAWWDEIAWMVRRSPLSSLPPNRWTLEGLSLEPHQREQAIRQLLHIHKEIPWEDTAQFREELGQLLETGSCPLKLAEEVWMDWDMARALHAAGMELGGHTVTHPVLANLNLSRQRQEIVECKARIEQETGATVTAFSYPVGTAYAFTEETAKLVRLAGYQFGFSFCAGLATGGQADRYTLPRFAVVHGASQAHFRARATWPAVFAG